MHEKRASHQVFYINREHRLTVSVMKTMLFVFGKGERQSPHAMIEIPRTDLGTSAVVEHCSEQEREIKDKQFLSSMANVAENEC